jgi:hypothetical protein
MKISLTRLIQGRSCIAVSHQHPLSFRQYKRTSNDEIKLTLDIRLIQSMCQGHDHSGTSSAPPPVAAQTGSVQTSQSEQTRRQKAKLNKAQQRQQSSTPKEFNPLPTHEIIKEGSIKLANGMKYVDVRHPLQCRSYRHTVTCT